MIDKTPHRLLSVYKKKKVVQPKPEPKPFNPVITESERQRQSRYMLYTILIMLTIFIFIVSFIMFAAGHTFAGIICFVLSFGWYIGTIAQITHHYGSSVSSVFGTAPFLGIVIIIEAIMLPIGFLIIMEYFV